LLDFVDDATGNVPAAHFQVEHEDSAGYPRLTRALVQQCGFRWPFTGIDTARFSATIATGVCRSNSPGGSFRRK
jgi:hypothetical protein